MKNYNCVIASDHSGYALKNKIISYLQNKLLLVGDYGPDSHEIVDYPDYAKRIVDGILESAAPFGILICGTGLGMSITANRSSGIRAALCCNLLMAERARAHNDANILVLGAKIITEDLAYQMVDKFSTTRFEGGRHSSRIVKLI